MRVMHVVTSCHGCPMYFEGAKCTHSEMPVGQRDLWNDIYGDSNNGDAVPPDRCPLRKGDLLITLRVS